MKYLIGSRGSGITTQLLMEAVAFDGAVLVPTEASKMLYANKCANMGIEPPKIVSLRDLRDSDIKNLSIDNLHILLRYLLAGYGFEGNIVTVGDSVE